jgi:quercetin dioxygenase-like cupin family protein
MTGHETTERETIPRERDKAIVLTEEEIDHLPTTALRGIGSGVSHRVLWEQDNAVAGVMRLRPHGQVDPHVHRRAYHDIWMIDGECEILGRRVTAGSYVHVPAGVEHGIIASGVGCTLLYVYRQP